MLKTFVLGVVLGVLGFVGALYAVPLVDLDREQSQIDVAINGGTRESFHINIPMDRIMVGDGEGRLLPEGLAWPTDPLFRDLRSELYKVRNSRDAVIGVAARTAARNDNGLMVDWVLHFPARGSLYFNMQADAIDDGSRPGLLRSGTREFADMTGALSERWVADPTAIDGAPAGRLELEARYLGNVEAVE